MAAGGPGNGGRPTPRRPPAPRSPGDLQNASFQDLSGQDFRGKKLYKTMLRGTKFDGADLTASAGWTRRAPRAAGGPRPTPTLRAHAARPRQPPANPQGASLFGSFAQGASFVGARLDNADLESVDFDGADLTNAVLAGAQMTNAQLGAVKSIEGADFTDAILRRDAQKALCSVARGTNPATGVDTRESLLCP